MDIVYDYESRFEETMTFEHIIHLYLCHVEPFPVMTFISICVTRGVPLDLFDAEARSDRDGDIEEIVVLGNATLFPDCIGKW